MILQCSHISKAFGTEEILSDISFHLGDHEKAAIVGVNGCGKSTLLKVIVGQISEDEGEVIRRKDAVVGYLAQNQEFHSGKTIYNEMQDAKPEVHALEKQMQEWQTRMEMCKGESLEQAIQAFDRVRNRYEQLDGYAYQSELTGVLKGLGFTEEDYEKPVDTLSGGEKTRVALAKMLLQAPDLVILDEPTNHLDLHAIAWLEGYLSGYAGAVLIVAHDRYFLDKIVTKVVELRQTKGRVYRGNYTEYIHKRQEILDAQMKQYQNWQAEVKRQEAVIEKLKSFNREKSVKRAESREKALDKMEHMDKPVEENTRMRLLFTPCVQSGNDVLHVEDLGKGFGGVPLFEGITFDIKRGEHVALIGDNGTGKTTFLKLIHELEPPDFGSITLGTNVRIAYYDQEHQILHPDKTIFEEIQDAYPQMNHTEIRNTLAAFLFTEDDVFKQIRYLSGGERGRVSLAKLMLCDANFLLLDEPTNHLDIDAKEILEHAIRQFDGTVLYVSHDRYFINTTATRILHLTRRRILNYVGNYDYYLEKREDVERAAGIGQSGEESSRSASVDQPETQRAGQLSWRQQKEEQARRRKLQNELTQVESEIEQLETRNTELDEILSDPANGTDVALLQQCSGEREENEARLTELMERWEQLSE